jgi:hypothetical protein
MSRRKPRAKQRFQRGINPYTGCNERDFQAGNYMHEAVKGLVREGIEAVLVPAGFVLDSMEWRHFPADPADPIVRLQVTPPAGAQETHDVRVEDGGTRPWGGQTGPTLVAWAKEHYSL